MEYLIVYSHNLLPKLLTDFIENLYYALQKIMLLQNQILTHFLEYIIWREGDIPLADQGGKSTSFMTLEGS